MFLSPLGSISRVPFSNFRRTPRPTMILIMERMSAISGTFVRIVFSFVRRAAHIIGKTAFFEPLIDTVPFSGLPPFTMNLAIRIPGYGSSYSIFF